MKKEKIMLFVLLLLAVVNLSQPFGSTYDGAQIIPVTGFSYPLAYVSIGIVGLLVALVTLKPSRTVSIFATLLALSNLFYSLFMIIVVSEVNGMYTNKELSIGMGNFVNCILALFILITMIFHIKRVLSKN